jgi:hypothetical protein
MRLFHLCQSQRAKQTSVIAQGGSRNDQIFEITGIKDLSPQAGFERLEKQWAAAGDSPTKNDN